MSEESSTTDAVRSILDAADRQIAQRPFTTEEIERVRLSLIETREWIADEEADLLDDEAIERMVRDGERLLATIAERDKALDDATAMLDVSNQQLAEIRAMVGDGPAAEAVRRALTERDAAVAQRDKTIAAADTLIASLRTSLAMLEAHIEEVRCAVGAKPQERTDEAVRRALKELFEVSMGEMKKLGDFAVDSIEENMRVGARGMRDACAQIAGALSTSPNAFVAATSAGIRKAIEALPLP